MGDEAWREFEAGTRQGTTQCVWVGRLKKKNHAARRRQGTGGATSIYFPTWPATRLASLRNENAASREAYIYHHTYIYYTYLYTKKGDHERGAAATKSTHATPSLFDYCVLNGGDTHTHTA